MKTKKEQKFWRICGFFMSIIGVTIMIFQPIFYSLGVIETVDNILTGLLMGFMLAQLGIDFMLIAYIKKVQMEAKK
jgi:hypothetical protein